MVSVKLKKLERVLKSKWFWGIIGALVISPISSGLWELVYKPAYNNVSGSILHLLTFGIKTLENNIYREIAKGMRERSSQQLFFYFIFFIAAMSFYTILLFKDKYTEIKEMLKKTEDNPLEEEPKDKTEIIKRMQANVNKFRKVGYFGILLSFFLFGLVFFDYSKVKYIDDSVRAFEQSYNIIAPYISEQDRLMLKSKFSLIQNKEDYDRLMMQMRQIARQNLK